MLSTTPRNSGRAEPWRRPANLADVAQSRLFDEALRAEIRELTDLAAHLEQAWLRHDGCHAGDGRVPPETLVRVRARITEAERLLAALRHRFPTDEIRSA
ncbi:MAG: hypothetical protein P4L86_13530 [Mycobacterium sp.]|nr:hypothetical protein [Mycobacterium sp.]